MAVGWSNVQLSHRVSATLYYPHALLKRAPVESNLAPMLNKGKDSESRSVGPTYKNQGTSSIANWDTVAVKSQHKIKYIGFSERTQNILLFELSIVNHIYLERHISRNPGVYGSITLPHQIKILASIQL